MLETTEFDVAEYLDTEELREAGITREGLYKVLSPDGNPAFSTVWNILHSIGYTLTPTPIAKKM